MSDDNKKESWRELPKRAQLDLLTVLTAQRLKNLFQQIDDKVFLQDCGIAVEPEPKEEEQ
jgi:hypothetical protein